MTYKWSNFNYGNNNNQAYGGGSGGTNNYGSQPNNNGVGGTSNYGNQQPNNGAGTYNNGLGQTGFSNNQFGNSFAGYGSQAGQQGAYVNPYSSQNNQYGGMNTGYAGGNASYGNTGYDNSNTGGSYGEQYTGAYGGNQQQATRNGFFDTSAYSFFNGSAPVNNGNGYGGQNQMQQNNYNRYGYATNNNNNPAGQQEANPSYQNQGFSSFRDTFSTPRAILQGQKDSAAVNATANGGRPERVDFNALFAPSGDLSERGENTMRFRRNSSEVETAGRSRGSSARYLDRGYASTSRRRRTRVQDREDNYRSGGAHSHRAGSSVGVNSRRRSVSSLGSPYASSRPSLGSSMSGSRYSGVGASSYGSNYGRPSSSRYSAHGSSSLGYSRPSSRTARPLSSGSSYRRRAY